MSLLIRNKDHLYQIVEKIKRVNDIFSVQRLMQ
jgi:guanosine-3',5'-bis(diphosphate) 3'-pyrophosphohydrolase